MNPAKLQQHFVHKCICYSLKLLRASILNWWIFFFLCLFWIILKQYKLCHHIYHVCPTDKSSELWINIFIFNFCYKKAEPCKNLNFIINFFLFVCYVYMGNERWFDHQIEIINSWCSPPHRLWTRDNKLIKINKKLTYKRHNVCH